MDYKLRQLLSSNHQLLLEIVKYISNHNNWVTIVELSETLAVSTRTTQRYIHSLEELVLEFNDTKDESLTFEVEKGKGVRFKKNTQMNQLHLKNFIYEKDETIQLLIFLLFSKDSTKKEYCEQFYLTEPSLSNHLCKIDHFLHGFDLKIMDHGLNISGKESQIRMVCYSVAWVLFEAEPWPAIFSSIQKNRIEQDIDLLITELNLSINYIKKRELSYLIAITLLRYRLGHSVRCEEEWQNYFPKETAAMLSNVVTKILLSHHVVSNEEIYFFTINMLTRSCIYEAMPLKKELFKFIQNDSIVHQATKLFLEQFSKDIFEIPIELYEDIFIFSYRSHMYVHLYKQVDFDYNANYLLDDISQKFPSYHTEMSIFINHLFEISGFKLFLEVDYLTQRYFMIETFIKPELLLGSPIKVSLETDLPEIYENAVKKTLYDYFKYEFRLIFLNSNYLQKSDITLTTITQKTNTDHTTLIGYPLKSHDFSTILKELKKIK